MIHAPHFFQITDLFSIDTEKDDVLSAKLSFAPALKLTSQMNHHMYERFSLVGESEKLGEKLPLTPHPLGTIRHLDSPPDVPNISTAKRGLLGAIACGSIKDIASFLDDDPDAAWMPMFDHNVEPPICAAVRLGCNTQIFDLLIARGADPTIVNKFGKNALEILASRPRRKDMPSHMLVKTEEWVRKVGMLLLAAGCKPTARNSHGETPDDVAASSQWVFLAALIRSWGDLKVCQMLHHTLMRKPLLIRRRILNLPPHALTMVFEFVLPQEVVDLTTSPQSQNSVSGYV